MARRGRSEEDDDDEDEDEEERLPLLGVMLVAMASP